MKKGILFLVAMMFMVPSLFAGAPKSKADHLAVASKYEKLAAEQEAVAKEHSEMKKEYRANQASLPKASREKSLGEMDKHCDALIQAAKQEADEYKAIAQWHKIRAEEVE